MTANSVVRPYCLVCFVAFSASVSSICEGQLRPLEPISWRLYQRNARVSGEIGASRLEGQRASLAGTSGDLTEIGNFSLAWRTGRVILEAAGTAQRYFRERERFAAPYEDVTESNSGRRHDSGDYRLSTVVRLTPDHWRAVGALRFGTRLPATDNTTGLDRDAVDFFATVGGRRSFGGLVFTGESGLGIHTTRDTRFEQDDLLLYALGAEYHRFFIIPSVAALGQLHGNAHAAIRGVENLGEVRFGIRAGSRRWIRFEVVSGYEIFSPSTGVIVTAGLLR
ncbi:MAG TPA: hypothetical protein VHM24_06270 [Gemmatimonadaceae bacterium]|nr:hypothetical protein [Gemmatimonadaceae bacterium]